MKQRIQLKLRKENDPNEPVYEKTNKTIWVPTRSDTNQPVQSQKMFRDCKILDLESRGVVLSE